MPTTFTARAVGTDDSDCLVAGVAEESDGTGRQLLFQAALEPPDEDDVEDGMDTYCLVTEEQGTAYGCVRALTVTGDHLRVVLADDALEDLGLPEAVVEVRLAADARAVDDFRAMLARILAYGRESARPTVLRI